MQIVPTTKMADAHNYSVSRNHWPGEPRDLRKTTSAFKLRPAFLEPILRHVFSINTSSCTYYYQITCPQQIGDLPTYYNMPPHIKIN